MKIKIYTKDYCSFCQQAKLFFKSKNLPYEEIDLTNKFDEIAALNQQTGFRTLPQIFINGEFIGGYTDMIEKVRQGKVKFDKD